MITAQQGLERPREGRNHAAARACFVAQEHPAHPNWPWLAREPAFEGRVLDALFARNVFRLLPRATGLYYRFRYRALRRALGRYDVAFLLGNEVLERMMRAGTPPAATRIVVVGLGYAGPLDGERERILVRDLQHVDRATTYTRAAARMFARRFELPEERFVHVPLATEEMGGYARFLASPAPISTPYVLCMGSPNRRFRAVARFCRRLRIPLVIVTRTPESTRHQGVVWTPEETLDELRALDAQVLCDLPYAEAMAWLAHARLLAFDFQDPSYEAGLATLMHALHLGRPVITTDALGMSEYVLEDVTGHVVPHGDHDRLAARIEHVFADDQHHAHLVRGSLERAQTHHSPAAAARRYAQLIDDLARHT